jgi:hypothetical protein
MEHTMQFIFGPILVALGILIMRYTVQITNFTGEIDFAERIFSGGIGAGTYTWWRLVGLAIAIIGGMWFFGIGGLLTDIIGNVFTFGG